MKNAFSYMQCIYMLYIFIYAMYLYMQCIYKCNIFIYAMSKFLEKC